MVQNYTNVLEQNSLKRQTAKFPTVI